MHTTEIKGTTFASQVEREGIVFLDFWAEWCGPCRTFGPIFEAAAKKHPDITWGKVDTEAERELAGGLGIRAIPTLMVFRDGILVFEQAGVMPGAALERLVDAVRKLDMIEVRRRVDEEERAASGPLEGATGG